jgi:hypothetical protein
VIARQRALIINAGIPLSAVNSEVLATSGEVAGMTNSGNVRRWTKKNPGGFPGSVLFDSHQRSVQAALTSIFFAGFCASAFLGNFTVSTPFLKIASILSASTLSGSSKLRWNEPKLPPPCKRGLHRFSFYRQFGHVLSHDTCLLLICCNRYFLAKINETPH